MKTNIKIKVNGCEEVCRVKLDANKFPYIVLGNEKIILNSAKFPRTSWINWGLEEIKMELLSGQEELEQILSNPDLTCDKLGLKQLGRIG